MQCSDLTKSANFVKLITPAATRPPTPIGARVDELATGGRGSHRIGRQASLAGLFPERGHWCGEPEICEQVAVPQWQSAATGETLKTRCRPAAPEDDFAGGVLGHVFSQLPAPQGGEGPAAAVERIGAGERCLRAAQVAESDPAARHPGVCFVRTPARHVSTMCLEIRIGCG